MGIACALCEKEAKPRGRSSVGVVYKGLAAEAESVPQAGVRGKSADTVWPG